MNAIAILELPYSEIAALLGIVSVIWGALSGFLVLWLNTKFVNKPTFYAERRETSDGATALALRVTAIEQAQALAREPITTMQKSVEEMRAQLERLTATIGSMNSELSKAIHDIDKRTVAIESKSRRSGNSGR